MSEDDLYARINREEAKRQAKIDKAEADLEAAELAAVNASDADEAAAFAALRKAQARYDRLTAEPDQ